MTYAIPTAFGPVSWEASVQVSSADRQEFDLGIKFHHSHASVFAQSCLSLHAGQRWPDIVSSCPHIFRGGVVPIREFDERLTDVPLSHGNFTAEETATVISESLRACVSPYVASVDSERAYFMALCQGDTPLKWRYGQPLLRAAEVAFLGVKLGASDGDLQELLIQRADLLSRQLDQVDVNDYVDLGAARRADLG